MQHAGLRDGEIESPSGPRDRHIHEPALLFKAVGLGDAVLVRKEALLEAC